MKTTFALIIILATTAAVGYGTFLLVKRAQDISKSEYESHKLDMAREWEEAAITHEGTTKGLLGTLNNMWGTNWSW